MLILDTEMENGDEYPTASQLLRDWVARLWAWLRWQAQPKETGSLRQRDELARDGLARDGLACEVSKGEESIETQDFGTGLIL